MPAHLRTALAGIGLAVIALTAGAQDTPPKAPGTGEEPVVGRLGRAGETTLFMMVRCGPHLTPESLKGTLQDGIAAGRCTIDGAPLIRAVNPAVFDEIESLTSQAADATTGAPVKFTSGIRRMASRDLLWEFRLTSPSQILKQLNVKYKSTEGKETTKTYTPAGPSDDGPLTLVAPGVYALKPEADTPVSYDAEVVSLGAPAQKLEGKWPTSDRHYVITLRNFKGDKDYLFHVLQDPSKVANPLDSVRLGSDLVFVFANLESSGADEDDDVIAGNNLILGAPGPRSGQARRGFILFPLDEKAMKENLAKFRLIKDSSELITKVRESATFADAAVEIGPDTPVKWIELPRLPTGRYRREVPLKDFPGLLQKYPEAYGIVVWEFENEAGVRRAIQMKLPGGGQSMVREKEVRNWSNSLKERVNAPGK